MDSSRAHSHTTPSPLHSSVRRMTNKPSGSLCARADSRRSPAAHSQPMKTVRRLAPVCDWSRHLPVGQVLQVMNMHFFSTLFIILRLCTWRAGFVVFHAFPVHSEGIKCHLISYGSVNKHTSWADLSYSYSMLISVKRSSSVQSGFFTLSMIK